MNMKREHHFIDVRCIIGRLEENRNTKLFDFMSFRNEIYYCFCVNYLQWAKAVAIES